MASNIPLVSQTPEPGTKRPIDETVSPSEVRQGGHVGSPHPLRRKESSASDAQVPAFNLPSDSQRQSLDLVAAIQSALISPQVVNAITSLIMPTLTASVSASVDAGMQPLHDELRSLRDTIISQQATISNLNKDNHDLRRDLGSAHARIEELSAAHDDLEQYGRRNILRFHRVPLDAVHANNTDQVIVNLCNDRLGVSPPIQLSDIDRSHTIGKIDKGVAQIICKFVTWNCKFRVSNCKKNLRNHKSPTFNVFVTEDLTAKRRQIVHRLIKAKTDKCIHSFWTTDGRIYYKHGEDGRKIQVTDIEQITHLVPDQSVAMDDNPWGYVRPNASVN